MWCGLENEPIEMLLHQTQHLFMKSAIDMLPPGMEKMHGGQAGIIFVLKFKGGMSQKELAEHLHLSPPSITSAIKKLEAGEYVIRKQDEKDQRIMRLSITPKGERFVEYVIAASKQAEETAMKNISKEEELLLRRLLKQMRDNLAERKN